MDKKTVLPLSPVERNLFDRNSDDSQSPKRNWKNKQRTPKDNQLPDADCPQQKGKRLRLFEPSRDDSQSQSPKRNWTDMEKTPKEYQLPDADCPQQKRNKKRLFELDDSQSQSPKRNWTDMEKTPKENQLPDAACPQQKRKKKRLFELDDSQSQSPKRNWTDTQRTPTENQLPDAVCSPHKGKQMRNEPSCSKLQTDFDTITKLGNGSFGTVFKARHKMLNQYFAIKIVHNKEGSLTEAKALCKLTHDNIVRYYDCWEDDGPSDLAWESGIGSNRTIFLYKRCLHIKMEFCDGPTLREWIHKHTVDDSVNNKVQYLGIIRQIVTGVEYFHSKGYIHRDLKPENIMIVDNKVKIADFGLAHNGPVCISPCKGTPHYMAPEQETRSYNNKVDIFALGLIYFEILWEPSGLFGKLNIWNNVKRSKFPPSFMKTFFHEYQIIRQTLHSDPNLRPAASKLKAELEQYSATLQIPSDAKSKSA